MQNEKLSISVSSQLIAFIEEYKLQHHFDSHSEVIIKALKLLQQQGLKSEYKKTYSSLDKRDENLEDKTSCLIC